MQPCKLQQHPSSANISELFRNITSITGGNIRRWFEETCHTSPSVHWTIWMCLKKYRIAFQAGGQKHIDRYFYIVRATVLQNQNSFNVLHSLENRDLHNTRIPRAVRHTVLCKSFWPPTKWRYSLSIKKYEGNWYYTKLVVNILFNFCQR